MKVDIQDFIYLKGIDFFFGIKCDVLNIFVQLFGYVYFYKSKNKFIDDIFDVEF